MTDKEKAAIVKAAFPDISGTDLDWAIHLVEKNDSAATYKQRIGVAPHILKNEVPLAGGALKGGKVVADLIKSFLTKKGAVKATEEVVATKAKMSLKKKAVIGAGVLAVGQAGSSLMNKQGTQTDANASAAQAQSQDAFAQAIANADAQGLDVTQFLSGDTAKQLGLGANNIQNFMAAKGYTAPLVGLKGIGIFTGTETPGTKVGPKGLKFSTSTKELVSLAQWNKTFPADLNGINSAKQKFVAAGVLDPTADVTQVKAAWTKYGQMSLDYARAGNILSPWQILDIQKGLTGGGGGSKTSVTIDESPMANADITTLLKRQLSQSLGLANIDDAVLNKFIKDVRKKEAKNPTKTTVTTTGNKSVRKTVQGYGQADVLADAEAYAKQDPRYSDFQTADVFGNALVKALGLKG
jgi:hypothetical protein